KTGVRLLVAVPEVMVVDRTPGPPASVLPMPLCRHILPRHPHRVKCRLPETRTDGALDLHPDVDLPAGVRITLAAVLRVRVPGVLDLLDRPREHPGGDVGVPEGRTLPGRHVVVTDLAEEDAAGHVVEH